MFQGVVVRYDVIYFDRIQSSTWTMVFRWFSGDIRKVFDAQSCIMTYVDLRNNMAAVSFVLRPKLQNFDGFSEEN